MDPVEARRLEQNIHLVNVILMEQTPVRIDILAKKLEDSAITW